MGIGTGTAVTALVFLAVPGLLALPDHSKPHARKLATTFAVPRFITENDKYTLQSIDWSSVISACRGIGQYERRMHNFNIRSAFHDGLQGINTQARTGGMDGSLWVSKEEHLGRNEGFTAAAQRALSTVAIKYGISMADASAICGAVGVEELSAGRVHIIGLGNNTKNFPVGRFDSDQATGMAGFAYSDASQTTEFGRFWNSLTFSTEEGVALLGAHNLFDNQGCTRSSKPGDVCNPDKQSCINQVAMFKWDNHYYNNLCTGSIDFISPTPPQPLTGSVMKAQIQQAKCGFSSKEYLQKRLNFLQGEAQQGVKAPGQVINWSSPGCDASLTATGASNHCPHTTTWFYTVNDAFLGRACQGLDKSSNPDYQPLVQAAMRKFLDIQEWDNVFIRAYIKMVSQFATWVGGMSTQINGLECPSGYIVDSDCARSKKVSNTNAKTQCAACTEVQPGGKNCNQCCRCKTAWTSEDHMLPEDPSNPFGTPGTSEP